MLIFFHPGVFWIRTVKGPRPPLFVVSPDEKLKEVEQEVGDVPIYLVRLSDKLGIDPVKAAKEKIRINAAKYPIACVKGSPKKYSEYE